MQRRSPSRTPFAEPLEPLEPRRLLAAELVFDFQTDTHDSAPAEYLNIDGTVFFTASSSGAVESSIFPRSLWQTDGTTAGTVPVAPDLVIRDVAPIQLTNFDGLPFFVLSVDNESQLWRSDGTAEGTYRVLALPDRGHIENLTPVGDRLYFTSGFDLYYTSGNTGDLHFVYSFDFPNATSPLSGLTPFRDQLYFAADDGVHGTELWKTDGTYAGTVMVKDINLDPSPTGNQDSHPSQLTLMGDTLYFEANQSLWRTDGTSAGTRQVADVLLAPSDFRGKSMLAVGGKLFFSAHFGGNNTYLWRSDGTPAGTAPVSTGAIAPRSPAWFIPFKDSLLFVAHDGQAWRHFRSDGTPAGTFPLTTQGEVAAQPQAAVVGDAILFALTTASAGSELWRSNGARGAASIVRDILPGNLGSEPKYITPLGDRAVLTTRTFAYGTEPWITDGTADGTRLLRDLDPITHHSMTSAIVVHDGHLYFNSRLPASSAAPARGAIFRSDGTAAGTRPIYETPYGAGGQFTAIGRVFFRGPFFGGELASTTATQWEQAGPWFSALVDPLKYQPEHQRAELGGYLYYGATEQYELWRTDGTAAGTSPVADLQPGTFRGQPLHLTAHDGALYFFAPDNAHGYELWRSDGTEAGTRMLKDVNPGLGQSMPEDNVMGPMMASVNGSLLFFASDGVNGESLWRTDGTAAGTVMLVDFNPNARQFHRGTGFATVGDFAYFFALDEGAKESLWRTDGTAEGTYILAHDVGPHDFMLAEDGLLYFSTKSPQATTTIWRSDGSAAGTTPFAHVPVFNGARELTMLDGVLYFVAGANIGTDLSPDRALWRSDGTDGGTYQLPPIILGPGFPRVRHLTVLDGSLYYIADDGAHGEELWKYTPPAALRDGVLTLVGGAGDEEFTITITETSGAAAQPVVFVQRGVEQFTYPVSAVTSIRFAGGGGHDALSIDLSGGDVALRNGLHVVDGVGTTIEIVGGATRTLRVGKLDLDGGQLNIGRSRLVIEDVDEESITALIRSARNGSAGPWTGPGITSSAAGADTLTGLAVGRDYGTVGSLVIKHGYNGDANVDGRINADDYFRIDSGFLDQPADPIYAQGDFNFDEKINADDYFLIDSAFLGQGQPLTSGAAVTTVPSTAAVPSTASAAPERKAARKRPARPLFSDRPVGVLDASRRAGVTRRR